jgi:hypothetical protein
MIRAVVLATLVPTVALAEPETVERELRDLAIPDAHDRGFHAAAFAQASGGTTTEESEGAVALGGELRYAGARCDYIRAGGQARLTYRDGARASAEQWASACIPIFIMEFGHHLEWDVRPALLAPLGLRPGANRRETATFRWQPLRARLGHLLAAIQAGEAQKQGVKVTDPIDPDDPRIPGGDAIVFDTSTEWEFLWSPGGEVVLRTAIDVLAFGYVRPQRAPSGESRDFTVDVFRAGGMFVDDIGASLHVWATKLENIRIGPVFASGGIGFTTAGVGPYVAEYTQEIELAEPLAMVALETGNATVQTHVRATHDITLAPDGFATVDSRLTSGVTFMRSKTRLELAGTLARTGVHVPGSRAVRRITGGGSLSLAHALTPHLDATLQLDVGRSFYAANVSQLDFIPRFGVTAFAALQAHLGRRATR